MALYMLAPLSASGDTALMLAARTGTADAIKVLLETDPQVQKAVEAIPQARALYQNAKKIVAQRAGGPVEQP